MKNQNHPEASSTIKVEPIRQKAAIERIKATLLHHGNYRDYCLFTLGINTGYCANELLSIKFEQVTNIKNGDILELKQSKNKKQRSVTLNKTAVEAIQLYLKMDSYLKRKIDSRSDAPLFYSQRGNVLNVSTLTKMDKSWCAGAGCKGNNYGSHSMRKTWGFWQYKRGALSTKIRLFSTPTSLSAWI